MTYTALPSSIPSDHFDQPAEPEALAPSPSYAYPHAAEEAELCRHCVLPDCNPLHAACRNPYARRASLASSGQLRKDPNRSRRKR